MVQPPIKSRHAQYKNGDAVTAKKTLKASLKLSQSFPGAEEARKTLAEPGGIDRDNQTVCVCINNYLVISKH